ncbi:MAG: exo-alpha-sialidase [Bacteroidota bacterium]
MTKLHFIHYAFTLLFILSSCTKNEVSEESELESIPSPTGTNASLPYLVTGANGNLYLSWVEQSGDTAILKYAMLNDNAFGQTETIASGTDWFVNWADYPMMAVNSKGDMMAHYLAKGSSGTYSYNVNIVLKPSDSSQWSKPIIPHSDGTPTEHGFVTMLPLSDNNFALAWLDGRKTGETDHVDHSNMSNGAMTIRTAVMYVDGKIQAEAELDNRVCDCCQTTGVLTNNGPVFFFRDRSNDEIRDIARVRKTETGWSTPETLYNDNWKINGCPVNGPRADIVGNTIAVVWFSAPEGNGSVKLAFSKNAGVSFQPPIVIDSIQPLGRVDVVMINEQEAAVSWLAKEGADVVIKAQQVSITGEKQKPITIAKTSEARGSGFAQMALYNSQLFFAWTDFGEDEKKNIRIARLGESKPSKH